MVLNGAKENQVLTVIHNYVKINLCIEKGLAGSRQNCSCCCLFVEGISVSPFSLSKYLYFPRFP